MLLEQLNMGILCPPGIQPQHSQAAPCCSHNLVPPGCSLQRQEVMHREQSAQEDSQPLRQPPGLSSSKKCSRGRGK